MIFCVNLCVCYLFTLHFFVKCRCEKNLFVPEATYRSRTLCIPMARFLSEERQRRLEKGTRLSNIDPNHDVITELDVITFLSPRKGALSLSFSEEPDCSFVTLRLVYLYVHSFTVL